MYVNATNGVLYHLNTKIFVQLGMESNAKQAISGKYTQKSKPLKRHSLINHAMK